MASNLYTSDKRIYLNKEGGIAEKPEDRASLLVAEGASIPMELAQKHGLVSESAPEAVTVEEEEKPKAKTTSKKK